MHLVPFRSLVICAPICVMTGLQLGLAFAVQWSLPYRLIHPFPPSHNCPLTFSRLYLHIILLKYPFLFFFLVFIIIYHGTVESTSHTTIPLRLYISVGFKNAECIQPSWFRWTGSRNKLTSMIQYTNSASFVRLPTWACCWCLQSFTVRNNHQSLFHFTKVVQCIRFAVPCMPTYTSIYFNAWHISLHIAQRANFFTLITTLFLNTSITCIIFSMVQLLLQDYSLSCTFNYCCT